MNLLVDTNILIYTLRQTSGEVFHDLLFRLTQEGVLYISVISRFELLAGSTDLNRKKNIEFLDSFPLLIINKEIADRAGSLFAAYRRRGLTLDNGDLLLAATALEEKLAVLTTNDKHFPAFVAGEQHWLSFLGRKGKKETVSVSILVEKKQS